MSGGGIRWLGDWCQPQCMGSMPCHSVQRDCELRAMGEKGQKKHEAQCPGALGRNAFGLQAVVVHGPGKGPGI